MFVAKIAVFMQSRSVWFGINAKGNDYIEAIIKRQKTNSNHYKPNNLPLYRIRKRQLIIILILTASININLYLHPIFEFHARMTDIPKE